MNRVLPISNSCQHCSRALRSQNVDSFVQQRLVHIYTPLKSQASGQKPRNNEDINITSSDFNVSSQERGAMSRRLEEAASDALYEGGRSGRQAIEDSGFSSELKAKLLSKVESSRFRSENASAFAQAESASHVGEGSKDIAGAPAWTGNEATPDTVLRMLDDSHKRLRPGLRGPVKGAPGNLVDLRIPPKLKRSTGERLANARDKTSVYAIQKDSRMTEKEREEYRKELKDRFAPASRAVAPSSFRGLAALANERIEDAIARGQFKNIPRGKAIERDARADNPFIDTTEYIMNKMIQRQDIVPPWIEKQQELVKTADNFRGRMRHDWKRHVARTISSRGGTLEDQVKLANLYAEAEKARNPKVKAVEKISVPTNVTEDSIFAKVSQPVEVTAGDDMITVTVETKHGEIDVNVPASATQQAIDKDSTEADTPSAPTPTPQQPVQPLPPPFRDPAWNAAEQSYQNLAIQNLNSIARSYNLQAPDLAKKPYYNLERELNACYADVAPLVAQEIIDRARRPPKPLIETIGHTPGGVLERFGGGNKVKVWDERRAQYGFKEFWRDLWRKDEKGY